MVTTPPTTTRAQDEYDIHRTGRYSRPDPLGLAADPHLYLYAIANPLSYIDPLGEKSRVCCTPITEGGRVLALLLAVVLGACNPQVPIYLTAPPALSGAAVRVDGEQVATFEDADPEAASDEAGTTAIFKVSSGPHIIRVEKKGYELIEIPIDYGSDEEGYLDIRPDQVRRVTR